MAKKQKIASLEFARIIAIVAIIGLHCQMALTYWQWDETPWVGYILNQLARFAVPLFFLISGYLIQPKLSRDPVETFKNYAKPLMKIWVIWSLISLVMPFQWQTVAEAGYLAERQNYWGYLMSTPINTIFEGGLVHLWFIPALVIAVALVTLLIRINMAQLLLPTAVLLYVYGVFAGSYSTLTDLPAPFFTRNGPFFSTLLVAFGYLARDNQWQWSRNNTIRLILLGMALHFGEAYWLMQHDVAFNSHDFLFGTVIWALGVFMWLLAHPNFGNMPWVFKLSPNVLGIYVSHLLVVIIMMNIAGLMGLQDFAKDAFIYPATILVTLFLVKGIEASPLKKMLLR
ncbi:surface polysaccharide O-acyltransferase-like enzyme [Vibrio sp. ES.051]|uniref:acyltransferase n=1 Tax=Vibrio sp. ES.051 TaxID=1761909 RepID=UPI000BF5F6C1|nr:acyltransferase family protein [Vibrio sp. ES.051]PFG58620.1 surface polysaccharide O-acyltransferase-like enzyme [Vibrio sp. ES.051]